MKSFDIERTCRLNGQRPTARERWTAFYRLWRIAKRNRPMEAADCIMVLMADWTCLRLVQAFDELDVNRFMPKELRWQHVRRMREKRKTNQLIAAIMEAE